MNAHVLPLRPDLVLPPERRLRAMVMLLVALVLLAVWVGVGMVLVLKQQDAIAAEVRQNTNLARALEEQTLRVLATADQASVRLRALVQGSADFFALSAADKDLSLTVDIAADVPQTLACDRLRLKQIFNNLLSNAIKFTETGGVKLQVERQADTLLFHAEDTGPGIPTEVQGLIFEKFRQGSARVSHDHGGAGLGLGLGLGLSLSLSRALAERMQGTLSVVSAPGQGARFTLSLPCTVR